MIAFGTCALACGISPDRGGSDPNQDEDGLPDQRPAVDKDADMVSSDRDCDDNNRMLGDIQFDADCDGILTLNDCDDADPESPAITDDGDCDGTPTADDCNDSDPESTTRADDLNCDDHWEEATGIRCFRDARQVDGPLVELVLQKTKSGFRLLQKSTGPGRIRKYTPDGVRLPIETGTLVLAKGLACIQDGFSVRCSPPEASGADEPTVRFEHDLNTNQVNVAYPGAASNPRARATRSFTLGNRNRSCTLL
jgi:hypothetical protein